MVVSGEKQRGTVSVSELEETAPSITVRGEVRVGNYIISGSLVGKMSIPLALHSLPSSCG